MSATPSSKSSRSPASTLSRIGASVSQLQNSHCGYLSPVDDCVRQGLELVSVQLAVEPRPGLSSVVERDFPGLVEGVGRGDAHERAVQRPAGERGRTTSSCCAASSSGIVGVPSRRSVPGIFPVSCVCAGAVEDVVGDLERDPEREAVGSEPGSPPEPSRHAASNSFPVLSAQRSR